jgi:uridine kinase
MNALPTQLSLPRRPLVLGIGGCSGSGKTTLARELATQLDATLFPLDLYYRDLSQFPWIRGTSRTSTIPIRSNPS